MIAGDFKLVLNSIDGTGYFAPNTNEKILFQKLISNFGLTDSYRNFYPYTKIFPFSRSRPTSRLDRIYISSLILKIFNTSYYSIPFSDHNKAPIITLKIPSTTTFKSSDWKLNDSIISFPYINLFIESFIKTLSSPPNPIQQPLKWWDLFKTKIKILFYSKSQQSKARRLQNILSKRLHQAQLLQQHEQIANICTSTSTN